MSVFVTVEPSRAMRPSFAMWCLAQNPKIMTSSASGFDVPLSLYPTIPTELLDGAYVDGYLYDWPEPVAERLRTEAAQRLATALDVPAEVLDPPRADSPPVPRLKAETTAKRPATRKRTTRARKAPRE